MSNYDIYPLGGGDEFYGMGGQGMRVSFQAEEMLSAYHTFRAAVGLAE